MLSWPCTLVLFRNVYFLQIKYPRIISCCVNATVNISCELVSLLLHCCCKVQWTPLVNRWACFVRGSPAHGYVVWSSSDIHSKKADKSIFGKWFKQFKQEKKNVEIYVIRSSVFFFYPLKWLFSGIVQYASDVPVCANSWQWFLVLKTSCFLKYWRERMNMP